MYFCIGGGEAWEYLSKNHKKTMVCFVVSMATKFNNKPSFPKNYFLHVLRSKFAQKATQLHYLHTKEAF